MVLKKIFGRIALTAVAILCFVGAANAQVSSTTTAIPLAYSINESVTLSAVVNGGSTVTFGTPVAGVAAGDHTITTSLAWSLSGSEAGIAVCAYFTSPSAALTGPANVPASAISETTTGTAGIGVSGQNTTAFPVSTTNVVFGNQSDNWNTCHGLSTASVTIFATNIANNGPAGNPQNQPAQPTGAATNVVALSLNTTGITKPGSYSGNLELTAISE